LAHRLFHRLAHGVPPNQSVLLNSIFGGRRISYGPIRSLPALAGLALCHPVTTSISPCALTFTPATRSPAATRALTALVTSCCRNVEGARAMGVNKSIGHCCERAARRQCAGLDFLNQVIMGTQDSSDCAATAGGLPDRAPRQRQNSQQRL